MPKFHHPMRLPSRSPPQQTANLFDDDSNSYANFLAKSASCEAFVERTEHLLFKATLPVSSASPATCYAPLATQPSQLTQHPYHQAAERITFVEWAKKMLEQSKAAAKKAYETSKDNYAEYQEKKRRKKDPYSKWESSPDQVEIKVSWHDETDTKHMGWLKVDPDCPVSSGPTAASPASGRSLLTNDGPPPTS